MLPIARRTAPLALAIAMVLAFQGSALAATTQVAITEGHFTPSAVTIALGGSVQWTNNGQETHTSTSDGIDRCCPNGPALWDSGDLAPGGVGTFPFAFTVAGTYPYHCTIHTVMKGTVRVKGKAKPRSGTTMTVFKVTWATTIPAGYVVNVQIERPGGSFTAFLTGTSAAATTFTPDAGTGTYRFRFQLQQSGSATLLSGFSPPVAITVG